VIITEKQLDSVERARLGAKVESVWSNQHWIVAVSSLYIESAAGVMSMSDHTVLYIEDNYHNRALCARS
jgi:hypothetical protein